MNILLTVLLALAGIFVLLLFIALLLKKTHYVKREIIINTHSQKVFDFLRFLKNQERFNKWASTDKENRKEEFNGTDGTVGFIYSWSGNKGAGKGEKEIINLVEGKKVETEIRFVKPIRVSAAVIFEIESLPGNQANLIMINSGRLTFPINIMIPMLERNFSKDMDESLSTLKSILEE